MGDLSSPTCSYGLHSGHSFYGACSAQQVPNHGLCTIDPHVAAGDGCPNCPVFCHVACWGGRRMRVNIIHVVCCDSCVFQRPVCREKRFFNAHPAGLWALYAACNSCLCWIRSDAVCMS